MSLSGLLVNSVDITKYSDPINVGGANAPTTTTVTGVSTSIQQSSAAPRTDQDIEGTVASGKAFFDHDPGVRAGDILTYGTRSLVCDGAAINEAGRGVLWTVRWSETT